MIVSVGDVCVAVDDFSYSVPVRRRHHSIAVFPTLPLATTRRLESRLNKFHTNGMLQNGLVGVPRGSPVPWPPRRAAAFASLPPASTAWERPKRQRLDVF